MELHGLDAERLMSHPHDLALGGFGADLETIGEILPVHDERMVTGGLEGIGQVAKDRPAVMADHRGFAVHQALGAYDLPAERDREGLVAETDAQQRQFPTEVADRIHRDPRLFRGAGTGGNDEPPRLQRFDLRQSDLVVPVDQHLLPQLAEILHEVVCKGVVIVDHQQHDNVRSLWQMAYGPDKESSSYQLYAIRYTLFFSFQSLLGEFDGLHHRPCLVAGLFVLMFGDRIGDDSGSGLDIGLAALDHDGPDVDAHVHVAGKPEVSHRAGIGSASRRLQFFDDLHGSNLRRAGHGPGRKAGPQYIVHRLSLVQPPRHLRHDMHDVGIALDLHQRLHLHRSPGRDPSHVVPPKVHQHDVFGPLLFIGQQPPAEFLILLRRLSTAARPGDGSQRDLSVFAADQRFRRGPHELHPAYT